MFKIPCGATILFNHWGQVLIGYKIKKKAWEFPGGKADPGEKIHNAAVRELQEETNLYVPTLKYVGYYDEHEEHLVHIFTAKYGGLVPELAPPVELMEPDKYTEWKWVDDPTEHHLTKVSQEVVALGFYYKAHDLSLQKSIGYEGL